MSLMDVLESVDFVFFNDYFFQVRSEVVLPKVVEIGKQIQ